MSERRIYSNELKLEMIQRYLSGEVIENGNSTALNELLAE